MSEWVDYELKDVVEKFIDYRGKTPEKKAFGIPLITAKIVKNGTIQPPTEYIAVNDYTAWMRRGYPEINDVVMTTEAPLGEVALLKDKNVALAQRIIIIRGKKEISDNRFLKYYLQSPFGQEELQGRASGTTVEGIKAAELRKITISVPPLPEQRAIAGVLSCLDDKIDLLQRQNKTLEGIAEALWRKMFVEEADPGWRKGKLGYYGEFKNGINYSRNEIGDTKYSILNVRDIIESKYVNVSNFEKICINSGKATPYLLKKGDIVIVRSASPGESLIVLDEIDNLIYSGFSIRLRCNDKEHSLFLFQFLQSFKKEMDIFSDGTTLKNINQEILNSIELVIPEKNAIKPFNERALSIYNKILLNQTQIRTLSRLRDILLPKLMSGKVRVQQ